MAMNVNYRNAFRDAAQQLCLDIAEDIVAEIRASPLTPGKSGRLREGYRASLDTGTRGARITGVPYWAHVEYGHHIVDDNGRVVGHAGQKPHVRPAVEFVRWQRSNDTTVQVGSLDDIR